jgi:hypothetical protein
MENALYALTIKVWWWHVTDLKIIFEKKLGARLIRAKGKTHPGSSEIDMSFCKIQKNNSESLHDETRADICIPGGLLFMWSVVPSFP